MSTSSISSGQTSTSLTVSAGVTLEVLAGGRIDAGTIDSGGSVFIQSGGTASGTFVQSGGAEYVLAGGSAGGTRVDSGGTEYVSGGAATGTTVSSGGTQYVMSGGSVLGTTVDSGGAEYVSAGGSAFATVLSSGGFQFVSSGGVVSGTVVNFYTYAFVSSGGVASAATVNSGGIVYVTGGSAVGTVLNDGGDEYVVSGGIASGTVVQAGAAAFVSAAGVASSTTVESGGALYVSAGSAFATVLSGSGAETVGSGGLDRSATVLASALEVVSSGGIASHTTVAAGGAELVLSGGSAVSAVVSSGGVLVVLTGGSAKSSTVATGGVVSNAAVALQLPHGVSAWAASAGGASVGSGDTLYVASGGLASGATLAGGSDVVQGGTAIATAVTAGGTETVRGGGILSSSTVGAGGVEFVSSGGLALAVHVANGGLELVSSGGNASAAVISAGGSAAISQGGRAGGVTIEGGGTLVLNSGASTYASLDFAGFGGVVAIGGTAMPAATISGFAAGDTLDLTGFASLTATLNSGTDVLAVVSGGTTADLQLAGNLSGTVLHSSGDGNGGSLIDIPCFTAGTRIATERGEIPVEALAVGDRVLTASGALRPVRWIGRRLVACARHSRPENVQPVRIVAGAFAEGRPRRDLFLSPDHAVFAGGVLIPARYLVNGRTVAPAPVASLEYLHVELDRHDVLLAEGLPAESFLDTGNRGAFANGGGFVALRPDFALRVWQAEGCAELVTGGEKLVDARRLLLARAALLGHRISRNPTLTVVANGRRLAAEVEGGDWRVRLKTSVARVALRSRIWIPVQTDPAATDPRTLGVAISRLALDGRAVPLDSSLLTSGWHAPEAGWRWTDGAAEIYVAGAREVSFTVAIGGRYWWSSRGRQERPAIFPAASSMPARRG